MKQCIRRAALLCALILCCQALLPGTATCEKEQTAIGVVLVNDAQTLPATRVYGQVENGQVRFDLDAACAYYVRAEQDVGYAGYQNFSRLRYSADCDTDKVGAEGTISFQAIEGEKNTVSAYYLFSDEKGPYFDPSCPFAQATCGERIEGKDFLCDISVEEGRPAERFRLESLNDKGDVIEQNEYALSEVKDEQDFALPKETVSVRVTALDANGSALRTDVVGPDDRNPYVCFTAGGQLLDSKVLNLLWPQFQH